MNNRNPHFKIRHSNIILNCKSISKLDNPLGVCSGLNYRIRAVNSKKHKLIL